jgi:hypothetical protein
LSQRKILLVVVGVVVVAVAAALALPLGAALGALSIVLPWSSETSLTEPGEPLVVATVVEPAPGNSNIEGAEGQDLSPDGGGPIEGSTDTSGVTDVEVSGNAGCRCRDEMDNSPAVTISPTSGPSGTLVEVVACGFPAGTEVSVGLGPANSQFSEVAKGTTDAEGLLCVEVPVQGGAGMSMVFAVAAEGEPGVTSPDRFQITE